RAQREEVLAERLPQLVLPRDPERLVLLHGVQRPLGGAVEAEHHAAAAARPGLDDHRGEHERLVPQLRVVDDEQVAVGRRPRSPASRRRRAMSMSIMARTYAPWRGSARGGE